MKNSEIKYCIVPCGLQHWSVCNPFQIGHLQGEISVSMLYYNPAAYTGMQQADYKRLKHTRQSGILFPHPDPRLSLCVNTYTQFIKQWHVSEEQFICSKCHSLVASLTVNTHTYSEMTGCTTRIKENLKCHQVLLYNFNKPILRQGEKQGRGGRREAWGEEKMEREKRFAE